VSYEARRLFGQIEQAKAAAEQLKANQQRLEAQRRSDGTHLRVERDAREKLGMRLASPDVTIYVADASAPRLVTPLPASGVRP
jgi:cell division protein FtsL